MAAPDVSVVAVHAPGLRRYSERRCGRTVPRVRSSSIEELLDQATHRQTQEPKGAGHIFELLSASSAMEQSVAQQFRAIGTSVQEFCHLLTAADCAERHGRRCHRQHFRRVIRAHTDVALGYCSYLHRCRRPDVCRKVHYEVDHRDCRGTKTGAAASTAPAEARAFADLIVTPKTDLRTVPPQWIQVPAFPCYTGCTHRQCQGAHTSVYTMPSQCDIRYLDLSVLGKFGVIMADPPWDIRMDLPYGTMKVRRRRVLGPGTRPSANTSPFLVLPTGPRDVGAPRQGPPGAPDPHSCYLLSLDVGCDSHDWNSRKKDDGYIFLWVTSRAMEVARRCLTVRRPARPMPRTQQQFSHARCRRGGIGSLRSFCGSRQTRSNGWGARAAQVTGSITQRSTALWAAKAGLLSLTPAWTAM